MRRYQFFWNGHPTLANCKSATISTSDLVDPPLPATVCVRTFGSQNCDSAERFRSGTLPPCSTAEKVFSWCLVSCEAVDEVLRCLSSSLRSVRPRPGSVGRWRASPGSEIPLDVMRCARCTARSLRAACTQPHRMSASIVSCRNVFGGFHVFLFISIYFAVHTH